MEKEWCNHGGPDGAQIVDHDHFGSDVVTVIECNRCNRQAVVFGPDPALDPESDQVLVDGWSSRFALTIAVPCPHCRVDGGRLCVTPSGWPSVKVHEARLAVLPVLPPHPSQVPPEPPYLQERRDRAMGSIIGAQQRPPLPHEVRRAQEAQEEAQEPSESPS